MTDLNDLAVAAKSDEGAFSDLFNALYVEKRRFMSDSLHRYSDGVDAEAVFNDALLKVVNEYQPGKSFIGLLRLRLDSLLINAVKSEMKRKHRELEHVEQYCFFSNNPLYVNNHSLGFRDYVLRLADKRLIQAIELLDEGLNWFNTSKQVGFANQETLKKYLRKAFEAYVQLNE